MRKAIIAVLVIILVGAAAAGGYWYTHRAADPAARFKTAAVARGDIVSTTLATGTIEPEEVIDVGAQVAGVITSFGLDVSNKPVDYNSVVTDKTILANIDPRLYQDALDSAQATLAQAQANVMHAQADLEQKKALLEQATNDWNRAQTLWNTKSGALADTTYDQYKATYETAQSNVDEDVANIKLAEASVVQDQAAVNQCKTNLAYCTIWSPVNGTIIDRRVSIGETVVSSLNTPSLFLIAKDLKRMQVWVSVVEADVGNIYAGQPAKFEVDAFPNEVFDGTVGRVRLNATMSQNVVTYTVEVNTDNSSLRLLPYLTANVYFETGKKENVLMVPNAALRWTPTAAQIAPQGQGNDAGKTDERAKAAPEVEPQSAPSAAANTSGERASAKSRTGGDGQNAKAGPGGWSARPSGERHRHAKVWVLDGDYVRSVSVTAGLTDGINTEVSGPGLSEGLEVVTGDVVAGPRQGAASASSSNGDASSPFTPQMPARKRGGR